MATVLPQPTKSKVMPEEQTEIEELALSPADATTPRAALQSRVDEPQQLHGWGVARMAFLSKEQEGAATVSTWQSAARQDTAATAGAFAQFRASRAGMMQRISKLTD